MGMYFDQMEVAGSGAYFNARSFLLLLCLAIPAGFAWLREPLPPAERRRLQRICPWLALACWVIFQAADISLIPAWNYSGGENNQLAWRTNNWICLGAGAFFSAGILWQRGFFPRLGGVLLLALNLCLMFFIKFQFWLSYQVMQLFPHGN